MEDRCVKILPVLLSNFTQLPKPTRSTYTQNTQKGAYLLSYIGAPKISYLFIWSFILKLEEK